MTDAAIVSDISTGTRQPAAQLEKVSEPERAGQVLLRTSRPFHLRRQRGRQLAKPFQRPVLFRRTREGMDHDALALFHVAHGDPRRKPHRRADLGGEVVDGVSRIARWQSRVKRKRETPHGGAEFVMPRAVPRDDPIKFGQAGHRPLRRSDRHHIQAGRGDTFHAIRKADERLDSAGHPDLSKLGSRMLQRREGDDAIANRPRSNQERLQRKSTAMRTSTVFGGKHMVSEQA